MTDSSAPGGSAAVPEVLRSAQDALAVKRVFGDAYEVGEVTVIPVAKVAGGGGGGAGDGTSPEGGGDGGRTGSSGSGMGLGYGISAQPVGVFVVRDDDVRWVPAVDRNKVAVLAMITTLAALYTARRIVRMALSG